jgi:hypothetical protein
MFDVDEEFGSAREFVYFGSTLTEDNIITEMKQRIVMTNRAIFVLKKQLSSR